MIILYLCSDSENFPSQSHSSLNDHMQWKKWISNLMGGIGDGLMEQSLHECSAESKNLIWVWSNWFCLGPSQNFKHPHPVHWKIQMAELPHCLPYALVFLWLHKYYLVWTASRLLWNHGEVTWHHHEESRWKPATQTFVGFSYMLQAPNCVSWMRLVSITTLVG